ncbi:MAG: hypothetical protein ABI162_02020 [Luteolibacter sp.]
MISGGATLTTPDGIRNVCLGSKGELITTFEYNDTQVYKDGAWKTSDAYAKATDISADGTAIEGNQGNLKAPIYINGKWTDIEKTAPIPTDASGPPSPWHDSSVNLMDTTEHGWILAERGEYGAYQHAAMMPIRAEAKYIQEFYPGVETKVAVGVDDFSIGSAEPGDTVKDRIWIMAPLGGPAKSVTIKCPLKFDYSAVMSAPVSISVIPQGGEFSWLPKIHSPSVQPPAPHLERISLRKSFSTHRMPVRQVVMSRSLR